MKLIKRFDAFVNIGVRSTYEPWEVFLTRKLNILTLLGVFNVSVCTVFLKTMGFDTLVPACLMTLMAGPFVLLLNKVSYILASYYFYAIAIVLFYFLTIKMGFDSYMVLYYFPVIISLVQVLGRRETIVHLIVIAALFFLSIIAIAFTYNSLPGQITFNATSIEVLRTFNITSSFFLAISLVCIFTIENIKQERLIKSMLHEKEVLLAEVFHRVKNNMNIVTSLLNLKKHSSSSEEVKQALEECRERVFSMALVHQKIYNNKRINYLNFKEYVSDLVSESINSIGGKEKVEVEFKTENVELPLNYAIPCGLILNELITNSFKHAQSTDKKLKLNIGLSYLDGEVGLSVKDNGPGFKVEKPNSTGSLGMDLIRSLSEQIDARYKISNNEGCLFEMNFHKN